MLFTKLLFLLVTLFSTVYLIIAKPLTKEEFDNSYAKYLEDLQVCKEDKVCTDKVNTKFMPVVDDALASGLEVSCGTSKPKSNLVEGKGTGSLTCSARERAPTSSSFNFYKLKL
ncbi:uncharacterized protein LOC128986454 [Macrosteles quadrilineatus]|uniref:uncharacterized protein LOC128986454 n=1 Tax=Macrosteles quadrilineatus TaxID=74068 RepID=UPI0023E0D0DB|nr:uncharacterized protein LOC128986454 [Macrosteles quadrilineatus]